VLTRTLANDSAAGRSQEVAAVVSFLVGPDGGWVNAQVVRANGGYV
jgi:3-oxoacyl-[acyl-carrier protein] reductase